MPKKATLTVKEMKGLVEKFIAPHVYAYLKEAKRRDKKLMKAFGFKENK